MIPYSVLQIFNVLLGSNMKLYCEVEFKQLQLQFFTTLLSEYQTPFLSGIKPLFGVGGRLELKKLPLFIGKVKL